MKVFGIDANIQPMPNPKPIRVQRDKDSDGAVVLIQGVSILPAQLVWRSGR